MAGLRGALREELKSELLEVVVYGEWIHKGTATSTKDEYNYAQRKILPGFQIGWESVFRKPGAATNANLFCLLLVKQNH